VTFKTDAARELWLITKDAGSKVESVCEETILSEIPLVVQFSGFSSSSRGEVLLTGVKNYLSSKLEPSDYEVDVY